MPYRIATCPESAHLEMIEHEDTPCGMLILGCSRFRPPGALACSRTCAARFDRQEECDAIAKALSELAHLGAQL